VNQPVILITTHRVQDGRAADLARLSDEFVESIETGEPGALEFGLYLSEDGTQLTHVVVQRDAEAMDTHMQRSSDLIARSLQIAETTSIRTLGTPGPILGQVLERNAEAGVPVEVQAVQLAGFSRAA
jgi:quinol monooxygenase YgiN